MEYVIELPLIQAVQDERYWLTVRATGPEDRVASSGPAPVERYHFSVEALHGADKIGAPRTAGYPQQSYALPHGLTEGQLTQLLALLADSSVLEPVFADRVEGGEHRAVVIDQAAAVEAAEWIDRTGTELARGEETPELPGGWSVWFAITGDGAPYVAARYLRQDDQRNTLPTRLATSLGALAWPQGRPEDAITQHPERLLQRLQGFGLLPPIHRKHIAAAAWKAGYRNIRSLGELLSADRKTLYTDLRSAGIEPTDRPEK